MTQGDPLSPLILNVFINVVLWHWFKVEEEKEAGPNGFGWAVWNLVVLFYADNGILASMRYKRLQWEFDTLTEIFDRVVLQKKSQKTVGVI